MGTSFRLNGDFSDIVRRNWGGGDWGRRGMDGERDLGSAEDGADPAAAVIDAPLWREGASRADGRDVALYRRVRTTTCASLGKVWVGSGSAEGLRRSERPLSQGRNEINRSTLSSYTDVRGYARWSTLNITSTSSHVKLLHALWSLR
jgi:hypothetical protein